jgi:hypothetical protein
MQAAAFARAQIRTIGNAIRKLSSELYTKDVHFIMELVQVGVVLVQVGAQEGGAEGLLQVGYLLWRSMGTFMCPRARSDAVHATCSLPICRGPFSVRASTTIHRMRTTTATALLLACQCWSW